MYDVLCFSSNHFAQACGLAFCIASRVASSDAFAILLTSPQPLVVGGGRQFIESLATIGTAEVKKAGKFIENLATIGTAEVKKAEHLGVAGNRRG